jgi:CDP-glucose 4,6-dehydratase
VYKNPENDNTESSDLGSSDYYSASKVSSELIIDSFINITMRDSLNISVVRSGNVIGGGDRSENRLITDIVHKLINQQNIEIRMPYSVRPWQYILDSLSGYLKICEENFNRNISETYNLNSSKNNKINVKEITELMIKGWGSDSKLIIEKKLKYGEVLNLNINSTKAKENLSWEAKFEMNETITKIIKWEKHHQSNNSFKYCLEEVRQYFEI